MCSHNTGLNGQRAKKPLLTALQPFDCLMKVTVVSLLVNENMIFRSHPSNATPPIDGCGTL